MNAALRLTLASAAGIVALTADAAQTPPIPKDMPYPVARRLLINLGYQPAPVPKPKCAAGREDLCEGYTELEACLNDAKKSCSFVWKHQDMVFEVNTRGESELLVDRIRCRAKCDEPGKPSFSRP